MTGMSPSIGTLVLVLDSSCSKMPPMPTVPPFSTSTSVEICLVSIDGPALVFAARELSAGTAGPAVTPPIVVEAATVLNQSALVARPVRVEVMSRSLEEAQTLVSRVTRWLTPMVLGDPSRIQSVTLVQADAPEGGVVRIAAAR